MNINAIDFPGIFTEEQLNYIGQSVVKAVEQYIKARLEADL